MSQEQLQDVRGSLIRQVDNIGRALPTGWHVALWFIDVESGRLDFDQRGHGTGHHRVDLPVARAGGLPDLLDQAQRRDCPFAAVVTEGSARVARYTYFGTKVEHELSRHGIELFTVEEGIHLDGKKAGKVLMRRVNQAISEWHALNVMELAWEGMRVHTQDGYNTGRVPYGYLGVAEPHPARARHSRGLTRTRLDVDPVRGPVITQIFAWRVDDHLTYHQIAARLNTDHELYPPPVPVRPEAAVGQWTWSAVRQMLQNPKYTGHQVWNRTTTRTGPTVRRKKSHRPNPIDQWVWSPTPTHPALVTLDTYRKAQATGATNQGSRATGHTNTHPATTRNYLLRGLIRCGICGRRMQGNDRNNLTYYRCNGPRNTAGKLQRDDHPSSIYVREDALLPAVINLIATRVFGPDRREHLRRQHHALPRQQAAQHAHAIEATRRTLDEITTRLHNLVIELETTPAEDTAWRASIRQRHQELAQQRAQAETKLADLNSTQPVINEGDPELLDAMPHATVNLTNIPPPLQRQLFDTLLLTIRLDNPRRAHVTITLTDGTPDASTGIVTGDPHPDSYPDTIATTPPTEDTTFDLVTTPLPVNRGDVLLSGIRASGDQDLG